MDRHLLLANGATKGTSKSSLLYEFLTIAHLLMVINQALLSGVGLELCRVLGPINKRPFWGVFC